MGTRTEGVAPKREGVCVGVWAKEAAQAHVHRFQDLPGEYGKSERY